MDLAYSTPHLPAVLYPSTADSATRTDRTYSTATTAAPAASARGGSTSHEPVAEYTTGAMTYWNGEKRKALAASGGMAVGGIIPPDSGIAHCTALAARLGFLSLMKTSVNDDVIRAVAVRKIASPATK